MTYQTANARDDARDKYLAESNAVILAPSMDRGVDFRDDHCRVVIVAKIPFPNLGDRRINARLRLPGGQGWYATQVARTLVQMTGRGVRSADDWAVSYILDGQFGKFWHEHGNLLPRWWRDAVEPIKIGDI